MFFAELTVGKRLLVSERKHLQQEAENIHVRRPMRTGRLNTQGEQSFTTRQGEAQKYLQGLKARTPWANKVAIEISGTSGDPSKEHFISWQFQQTKSLTNHYSLTAH